MKKAIVSAVFGLSFLAVVVSLPAGEASAQTYGSCASISNTLSVGSRGSQVLALQQFLVSQDYPGGGTWMETGYYGTATEAAVRDFQESRGLPETGVVDSATLSALENCNGTSSSYTYPGYPGYTGSGYPEGTYPYSTTYPYTTTTYPYSTTYPYNYYGYGAPAITSLSQNTGIAGQTITIYGQGFESTNTVYFDNEAVAANGNGSTELSFTIPYTSTTYENDQTVQLYVTNQDGTSNSVSFTLNPYGSSYGCGTYPYSYGYEDENCDCGGTYSYEYSDCGTCGTYEDGYDYGCQGNTSSPTVTYLSPNSGGVGTDVTVYGSGFTTNDNTVHFGSGIITGLGSPDGESVSFVVPSELTGYGSQPLTLGEYNVSVTNSNNVTSNAVSFDVTSTSGNGSGAPTITSVSGPTNVQTGVENTWEVTIDNPNSSYATVSVAWGDTGNGYVDQAAPQTIYGGTQTVSFSHAYETSGTYTLTFTVDNQNSQSNTYTETVYVSGSNVYGGTPEVNYVSPSSGYVGAQVTIYGSNFSTTDNNTIYFGSGAIQNAYSNGSSITFTIPSSVTPYCAPGTACPQYAQEVTPGTYNVSVMDQYGTSNEVSFTVL